MNKSRYIKCAHCGEFYTPQRRTGRYCKDQCRKDAHKLKTKAIRIEIDGFTKAENLWLTEVHKHWPRIYDLIRFAARTSIKQARIAFWCYMLSNWPELDLPVDLAGDLLRAKASDETKAMVGLDEVA